MQRSSFDNESQYLSYFILVEICFTICYHDVIVSPLHEFDSETSKMERFTKMFLFAITIGPSLCRQCDEDVIGFRKLGLHRESSLSLNEAQVQGHFRFRLMNEFISLVARFNRCEWK